MSTGRFFYPRLINHVHIDHTQTTNHKQKVSEDFLLFVGYKTILLPVVRINKNKWLKNDK